MRKQDSDKQQTYTDPLASQKAIHQLLQQVALRDQKISWINSEKVAALRSFQEKEQALLRTIAEKDAVQHYTQIQLTAREAQLDEILGSRSWKIALFLQRIRTFLVPPQSRLARVLQRGLDRIRSFLKKPGRD